MSCQNLPFISSSSSSWCSNSNSTWIYSKFFFHHIN